MDEVLEIVFQNTGSQFEGALGIVESHPFHAHGQHIYDIGSGPGKYDPEANNAKLAATKFRPVKRDTTMLYRYGNGTAPPGAPAGWRAWRSRMTQPGVWMIHCHILQHMIMGMQTVWVVGDAAQIKKIPLTVSKSYLVYGGDVYGNDTYTPPYFYYFDATDKCVAAQGFPHGGPPPGDHPFGDHPPFGGPPFGGPPHGGSPFGGPPFGGPPFGGPPQGGKRP